jgi:hypothetical protein
MLGWRRTALAIVVALLFLGATRLHAGDPATMGRHYVVHLDDAATAVDEPKAVALELALTYGGHLDVSAPGTIAVSMSAEEARLLAADPRVKAVRETTAPSAAEPAPSRRIIANDVLPPITVGPTSMMAQATSFTWEPIATPTTR